MKIILCFFSLFAFSITASAAGVEDRAASVRAELQGNNSYHAHLARELAGIAEDEIGQHDLNAAKSFMEMAEEHASQAGGAK